ncbi:MAG TPA: hypothetical protein VGK46_15490 [Saprospiraceae bacterium]|jgi:hypothetical protein
MKTVYCILIFLSISLDKLNSQLVHEFETWIHDTSNPPYNWEYPEGWSTSNPITEFCSFSVYKSDASYSGTYAALLKSVFIFDEYKPGVLLLGNANYQFSTLQMQPKDGYDLDLIPNRIKGWYKMETADPDARGIVEIKVLRKNETTQTDSVLLSTVYELSSVETYTSFDFLISYFIPIDTEHDKLSLAFYSNRPSDSTQPSSLWIDDVSLDFISASPEPEHSDVQQILISPNPVVAGHETKLIFAQPLVGADEISIHDQSGKLIMRVPVNAFTTECTIPTESWTAGFYYISMQGGAKPCMLILH